MKEKQISRRNFLKNTGKILIASPLVLKLLEGDTKAGPINYNGWLEIDNYIDFVEGTSPLEIWHEDGAGVSDGYDASFDVSFINPVSDSGGIYSDIITDKLRRDRRLTSSTLDFNIKLVYNGSLAHAKSNQLEFSLPYGTDWEFGDKEILFQSDRLKYGPVVDVREAIANNSGIVELIDLPAGTYTSGAPYDNSGILTIGTRKLADLDDNGNVDLTDYAILAQDWKKPQSQYPNLYVGDIVGPNGIPDGYVNEKDLEAFSSQWLADVNDPNTW
jgi:hypothetical protein